MTKKPIRLKDPTCSLTEASCDVPAETLTFLTVLLYRHREAHDVRPYQRAGTAGIQAKLVLRWFRDATGVAALGKDHGLSQATTYRYLHEGIDVLAAQSPSPAPDPGPRPSRRAGLPDAGQDTDPHRSPHRAHRGRQPCLVFRAGTSASAATSRSWPIPLRFPLWVCPVEPGSTHDITAARKHCLGALYPVAAASLPTLPDKGYQGAGIGAHTPIKGRNLAIDNRTYTSCSAACAPLQSAPRRCRPNAGKRYAT